MVRVARRLLETAGGRVRRAKCRLELGGQFNLIEDKDPSVGRAWQAR